MLGEQLVTGGVAAQRHWGRKKLGGQAVRRPGPGPGAFPEGGGRLGSSLSSRLQCAPSPLKGQEDPLFTLAEWLLLRRMELDLSVEGHHVHSPRA